jgi:hypothetical protein
MCKGPAGHKGYKEIAEKQELQGVMVFDRRTEG